MRGLSAAGLAARPTPAKVLFIGSTRTKLPLGEAGVVYGGVRRNFDHVRKQSTTAAALAQRSSHESTTTTTTTTATPDTTTNTTTTTSLSERFRGVMRLLPHPVVVCTALHPGPSPRPRAMTMSSMTSLSLSPSPLLSFNIKKPSRTLDALRASGRFSVHVLADDEGGARVAEWFSRGDAGRDPFAGVEACGCVAVEGGGRVELRGEGVRRVLRCRVEEMVGVRDHVIVVGEVEGIEGEGEGLSLAYADRGYRRVGEVMQRHVDEE